MKSGARWRLLCLTLIGLGLVVSGYLLARTFTLMVGGGPEAIDLCSAVFGASCDAALIGPTSWQLGIPLAGWGLVYYGTLAGLLVLACALGETIEPNATLGALLLAVMGASASVVLTGIVVTGHAPLCPLCFVIHAINLALLHPLWRLSGRTASQLIQALRVGGRYLVGGQTDAPLEARRTVVGFVTAMLVAVVLYQWVLIQSDRRVGAAQTAFNPDEVLAGHASG